MDNVLLINSYAGSLLAAAVNLRLPILGSYETDGYGLEVQRYNAPNVRYVAKTADWPRQDLSRTMVVGHPPCSAFSTLNTPGRKKENAEPGSSVNSAAFKCTRDLLTYAMENGAAAVLIESVYRALEEGASVHEHFAETYDYSLFRIIQDAEFFGVPQRRKRVWCIWLKGRRREWPVYAQAVKTPSFDDILTHEGEPFARQVETLSKILARIDANVPEEATRRALLSGEYGYGRLEKVVQDAFDDAP